MKYLPVFFAFSGLTLVLSLLSACRDSFLEIPPESVFSESVLDTPKGLEGLLIGAYSPLTCTSNLL